MSPVTQEECTLTSTLSLSVQLPLVIFQDFFDREVILIGLNQPWPVFRLTIGGFDIVIGLIHFDMVMYLPVFIEGSKEELNGVFFLVPVFKPDNESLQQREELALAGRLQEWYDSVRASAEAEAAMTDWTFTDGDGRRWGFADGNLYIGDYPVPMPSFAPQPGAARETAWRYAEVARQGQSAAVQQTVRERMEAIRARRDAERAAERARGQQADSTATQR